MDFVTNLTLFVTQRPHGIAWSINSPSWTIYIVPPSLNGKSVGLCMSVTVCEVFTRTSEIKPCNLSNVSLQVFKFKMSPKRERKIRSPDGILTCVQAPCPSGRGSWANPQVTQLTRHYIRRLGRILF